MTTVADVLAVLQESFGPDVVLTVTEEADNVIRVKVGER